MQPEELIALMLGLGMVAGIAIIFLALRQRSHALELRHRERMAMIERGLMPPPEMQASPHARQAMGDPRPLGRGRALTAGIVTMGLGLAFMTLISVAAGAPNVGIGLGGAVVVLGAAFVVVSLVSRQTPPPSPPPTEPGVR